MLDIKYIREHTEKVRENLAKRKQPEILERLDEVLKLDHEWKLVKRKVDNLRAEKNTLTKDIQKLAKEKKDISAHKAKVQALLKRLEQEETEAKVFQDHLKGLLMRIPNLLHESVPYGKDDKENSVVKKVGDAKKNEDLKPHGEILEEKGLVDFNRAAKASGKGFNYMKGKLALLDLSLQRFAIDLLVKKGFELTIPPFMMRREAYEGVTDLADFEDVMYKIEGENNYLIATAEHPIAGQYMNDMFEEAELPKKIVGISPCFRKEIGSHGVDEKGIFRVHQFYKIEQFVFCKPEESWKIHEELQANAEEIFNALELPFRVVNICTGDIGIVAAKKYDIEVWSPREGDYKEVTSCSNCTAYQAHRLNIKYWNGKERLFVHTLNATAVATSRALKAIVENNIQEDGTITVPKVLVPYTGFESF